MTFLGIVETQAFKLFVPDYCNFLAYIGIPRVLALANHLLTNKLGMKIVLNISLYRTENIDPYNINNSFV